MKQILFMLVVFGTLCYINVYSHEAAHASVCRTYGGNVDEMRVEILGGHVICDTGKLYPGTLGDYLRNQAEVEVWGYPMLVITTIAVLLINEAMYNVHK